MTSMHQCRFVYLSSYPNPGFGSFPRGTDFLGGQNESRQWLCNLQTPPPSVPTSIVANDAPVLQSVCFGWLVPIVVRLRQKDKVPDGSAG